MASPSQRKAVATHRRRLTERGLERFEVRGLEADKELIRGIARRLAASDEASGALRTDLVRQLADAQAPRTGGILAALRRSPLAGTDLDLVREETHGRGTGP